MLLPDEFQNEKAQAVEGESSTKEDRMWSLPKNMARWSSYLTFDIMGDLCFSNTFEMLEDPENHYMLDVLPAGVQGLNTVRLAKPRLECKKTKKHGKLTGLRLNS